MVIMAEPSPSDMAAENPYIDQSRQIVLSVCNAILLAIAYIAVLLRFISRRLAKTHIGKDDWWIWTALVGTVLKST